MPVPRSQPNTLGYALLGLLARGEGSGYQLTQGLKNPVSFFWHAQHSQIYPELAKLEAAGLVQHTLVEQTERPDKKVYRLTPQGGAALAAWVAAPTEMPRSRDELVLKAYSIWLADADAAAELARHHAQAHLDRLVEYEALLAKLEREAGGAIWQPHSKWFGVHAVLRRGIGFEREYAAWCAWLAESLLRAKPG